MKKSILFLALSLLFFVGCNSDENREYSVIQTSTPIESYDNESIYTPPTADSSQNESGNTTAEGLSVKDKKYVFDGKELVLINIKNQTDTNYSITVVGSYFDASGNMIQTETQTFEQFAAGYENYFVFSPDFSFERMEYAIATQEYAGELYVDDLTMHFSGYKEVLMHVQELIEQGDHQRHPAILAEFCYKSNASADICPEGEWILINGKDEIVAICPVGTWLYAETADQEQKSHFMIYYTTEEELVWPEHLKGEFKAVCSLKRITVEQP